MPTPCKPAAAGARKKGADALRRRQDAENLVRGAAGAPVPPDYLTDAQRVIWAAIVEHYADANLLNRLDAYTLAPLVVALDAVAVLDRQLNDMLDADARIDTDLLRQRTALMKEVWRGAQEYCLSPQARAKIGSIASQQREAEAATDPLLEALS